VDCSHGAGALVGIQVEASQNSLGLPLVSVPYALKAADPTLRRQTRVGLCGCGIAIGRHGVVAVPAGDRAAPEAREPFVHGPGDACTECPCGSVTAAAVPPLIRWRFTRGVRANRRCQFRRCGAGQTLASDSDPRLFRWTFKLPVPGSLALE